MRIIINHDNGDDQEIEYMVDHILFTRRNCDIEIKAPLAQIKIKKESPTWFQEFGDNKAEREALVLEIINAEREVESLNTEKNEWLPFKTSLRLCRGILNYNCKLTLYRFKPETDE